MFAFTLDQFGLLEMKKLIEHGGGFLVMQEEFKGNIFRDSFKKVINIVILVIHRRRVESVSSCRLSSDYCAHIQINSRQWYTRTVCIPEKAESVSRLK